MEWVNEQNDIKQSASTQVLALVSSLALDGQQEQLPSIFIVGPAWLFTMGEIAIRHIKKIEIIFLLRELIHYSSFSGYETISPVDLEKVSGDG